MNGWRARIGLIIPSANTVNEPEFYTHLPPGVSLHTSRFRHEATSVEGQRAMLDKLERCVDLLATADVDAIAFGCTSGSLVEGAGYEREVEECLRELGGVPAVATAASVVRALSALSVESVAVTTPYPEEIDAREAEFLRESGFEVVGEVGGPNIEGTLPKGARRPEDAYRQARAVDRPDADAVFVSCTDSRTFEVVERLEADLGKPVITSNSATLWDVLGAAGVDASGTGPGALFGETERARAPTGPRVL